MTVRRLAVVLCGLGLGLVVHELHAQAKPEAKATTPAEMQWGAQGGLAMAGMEQVNLVGNPSDPGPYTLRLKFPAGYRLAPHVHPDYREVTILSGTWYTGYGAKFDTTALKALPAGSFHRARRRPAFRRGARARDDPGERHRAERAELRQSGGQRQNGEIGLSNSPHEMVRPSGCLAFRMRTAAPDQTRGGAG